MIYKNLNNNIKDIIDQKIRIKHKKKFKEPLLFDLLTYFVKKNINFVKSYLIF
tara:strand:+ start:38 stop:196 length:159 start_codon:yes stop_codon:yes gene_type:complete